MSPTGPSSGKGIRCEKNNQFKDEHLGWWGTLQKDCMREKSREQRMMVYDHALSRELSLLELGRKLEWGLSPNFKVNLGESSLLLCSHVAHWGTPILLSLQRALTPKRQAQRHSRCERVTVSAPLMGLGTACEWGYLTGKVPASESTEKEWTVLETESFSMSSWYWFSPPLHPIPSFFHLTAAYQHHPQSQW